MTSPSTVGNRHGTWGLGLAVAGILALLAPAHLASVVVGTAVSLTAVALGVNGVLAARAHRATNRAQAVAAVVLGLVGVVLWLLAIAGTLLAR